MTKDELEKEACIYTQKKMVHYSADQNEVIEMLVEFTEKQIEILERELEKERKLNAEIKARFVECNTCTPDMDKDAIIQKSVEAALGAICQCLDYYKAINNVKTREIEK